MTRTDQIIATLQRLADTQANLSTILTVAEREDLRAAARILSASGW